MKIAIALVVIASLFLIGCGSQQEAPAEELPVAPTDLPQVPPPVVEEVSDEQLVNEAISEDEAEIGSII